MTANVDKVVKVTKHMLLLIFFGGKFNNANSNI